MVDEVLPSYYAKDTLNNVYELLGRGFVNIPNDAVGCLAVSNDDPLAYRYETGEFSYRLFEVSEKTNNRLVMTPVVDTPHAVPSYLGCIVSQDRTVVYWVNETHPLQV